MTNDRWNAHLYDQDYSFVSQYGEAIIELLTPQEGERILDVGCGTGDLSKIISDKGAIVSGIDKSQNMINQAIQKYPDKKFEVADVTELAYQDEFDAVFSNATLHWVKNQEKALTSVYNSLKNEGRFVAELGGIGNVQLITDEIKKQFKSLNIPYLKERFPWYFPSIGEYTSLMEKVGFKVTFAYYFDRPTPLNGSDGLKDWIQMFANTMFNDLDDQTIDLMITNVEKNLRETMFKDNKWIADYKRIRVIGVKAD